MAKHFMWSKIFQNNGILLVDDEISNDPTMRQIYKNAAVGMKVYIYTVEQALIKAKQASERTKLYSDSQITYCVREAGESGVNVGNKITLGPVSQEEGRTLLAQFTALNDEEIQACDYLSEKGKEIVFQNIPSTQAVDWKTVHHK